MRNIKVKPASPSLIVYYPGTRERLPDSGDIVTDCVHWQRALRRGDVVEEPLPPAKKKEG